MKRTIPALLALVMLLASACGGGGGQTDSANAADDTEAAGDGAAAGDDADETATDGDTMPAPAGAGTGFARAADCTLLTRGETSTIFSLDNTFAPDCVVLVANQVLRVQNFGIRDHTFTVSENQDDQTPFLLDLQYPGETTIETKGPLSDYMDPGTYEFFCKLHSGMDGAMQILEPVGA